MIRQFDPEFAPETLPQALLDRAGRTPESVAQRHKSFGVWREYNWTEVLHQVRAVALGLHVLGLQPGETVATIGENEPEHFWAEFAAQAVGAKFVSLYPDLTPAEVEYILLDSEAVYLVAQDQEQVDKALEILERTPAVRKIIYWDNKGMWGYTHPKLISFTQLQALGRELHNAEPQFFEQRVAAGRRDDTAVISYTSGTTSAPKGVILTHRWLFDVAARMRQAFAFHGGMDYLSYISPAWAMEQIGGIGLGVLVPFVVNFPESPESVQANIREIGVEVLFFNPRQWENLAALVQARMFDAGWWRKTAYRAAMKVGEAVNVNQLDGKSVPLWARCLYPLADWMVLHHLRDNLGLVRATYVFAAGTAMAPEVFRLFRAMGVSLRNLYGTSEFGPVSAHQDKSYDVETAGKWLECDPQYGPPIEARVSAEGELQLRGASGFLGYYRKPEKSAERLTEDGWFRSGDAVSFADSGDLVFLDRVEDLRHLATGHKYPPQFIETRLRFSAFIKDILTLGDETRPYVAALVNINSEVVGQWAEDRNIVYSNFANLSQNREIIDRILEEIANVNRLLPPDSRIVRFANFPKELDPDEGELTRTRKLRREFLEERYRTLIEGIYSGQREVDCNITISYQDGRKGVLEAKVMIADVEDVPLPVVEKKQATA